MTRSQDSYWSVDYVDGPSGGGPDGGSLDEVISATETDIRETWVTHMRQPAELQFAIYPWEVQGKAAILDIRRLQDGLVAESLDGSGSHFVGASAEDLVAAVEAQVADPSRFMMRSIVPIAPSVEEG